MSGEARVHDNPDNASGRACRSRSRGAPVRCPSDIGRARTFIGSRLHNEDSVILAAHDEAGDISGFCQLYRSLCSVEGGPIYISYDLLLAAEHHAFDHGAIRMNLRTGKSNSPAQKLHEAHGWIQDQRFQGYSKKPGRA